MPEVRNLTEIRQAEEQAVRLEATLSVVKAALEELKNTSVATGEFSRELSEALSLVEKIRYTFHHLNRENLPQLITLMNLLNERISNITLGNLPDDIKNLREEVISLMSQLENYPRVTSALQEAITPKVLTNKEEFLSQIQTAMERFQMEAPEEASPVVNAFNKLMNQAQEIEFPSPTVSLTGELQKGIEMLQQLPVKLLTAPRPELLKEDIDRFLKEFPQTLRGLIDVDTLIGVLQKGDFEGVNKLVESSVNTLQSYINVLNSIEKDTRDLSRITPVELDRLVTTTERYGRSVSSLLNQYLTKLGRESGLEGVFGLGVQAFDTLKRFGTKGLVIFSVMEAAFRTYSFMQETYMKGRELIQKTQVPGMGMMTGIAQNYEIGRESVGNLLRAIALRYQQQQLEAFYRYRIPEKEYESIWSGIKQKGLMVMGTFEGVSLASEYQKGKIEEAMALQDKFAISLYKLSAATGLTYNALMDGAKAIMRLTGSHDIERSMNTFVALNEIGNRLGVTGEEFTRWVTNATESLKWYGFAVGANTNILSRYSQALYEGLVSVGNFTEAVKAFTSNQQTTGIGFITAMQSQTPVGGFLREIKETYGLADALIAFRMLLTNSRETIHLATTSHNEVVRRTAIMLEEYAKQFGGVGALIQEARREVYGGTERMAMLAGGGQPFLSMEIYRQITGLNEQNLGRLGIMLDATATLFSQKTTESISSYLKPITSIDENIKSFTSDALETGKSIKQHVSDIHRFLIEHLSEGSPLSLSAILSRPRTR